MYFYLINVRLKLHHRKWRKLLPVNMSTVLNFLNFTSSLLTLFFVQHLSGNCHTLPSIVTFMPCRFFKIKYLSSLLNGVKNCHVCLIQRQNSGIFRCSVRETKSRRKTNSYMKTEACCKLNFRVIWIFLPNVIKIDPYIFHLYRFKVGVFSEIQHNFA